MIIRLGQRLTSTEGAFGEPQQAHAQARTARSAFGRVVFCPVGASALLLISWGKSNRCVETIGVAPLKCHALLMRIHAYNTILYTTHFLPDSSLISPDVSGVAGMVSFHEVAIHNVKEGVSNPRIVACPDIEKPRKGSKLQCLFALVHFELLITGCNMLKPSCLHVQRAFCRRSSTSRCRSPAKWSHTGREGEQR